MNEGKKVMKNKRILFLVIPLIIITLACQTLTSTGTPTTTQDLVSKALTLTAAPTSTIAIDFEIVTATPLLPDCPKPTRAQNIELSENADGNGLIVKSPDECLMMSEGGGTRGKAVLGTLVDQKITLIGYEYDKYYVFHLSLDVNYVAEKGILAYSGITTFHIMSTGWSWAQNTYEGGDYWFAMKNVTWQTRTAIAQTQNP